MKPIFLIFLLLGLSSALLADEQDVTTLTKTPEDDQAKIEQYNLSCQTIDQLLVRKQFKVDCFSNYQHFGPSVKVTRASNAKVRIAGYNLLHPGTSKSLFKDYSLVAKIMNRYDLVSGLEILDTVGHDKVNDEAVVTFLKSSPQLLADLENQKSKIKDLKKQNEIDAKIQKIKNDTQTAYSLYRGPGYFKLLMALKKLDPSWALILSPRGDSALQGSVEEMVGFFYRGSVVAPTINPHCKENLDENGGTPVACILNLSSKFMGKDYTHFFARRPFMGTFKSGSMKFTVVSTHIVFNFSGDEEASTKLMQAVFGVDLPSELGVGINASNFARFAEVKMTLNFMDRFRKKYGEKKIMLVSDTNLVSQNAFWPEVLKSFPGSSLLIDEPTTISPPRYSSNGKETQGVASAYDHFILDKSEFSNCDDGEVYNYYQSDIQNDIEQTYLVRNKINPYSPSPISTMLEPVFEPADETKSEQVIVDGDIPPEDDTVPTTLDYSLSAAGKARMDRMVKAYSSSLESMMTIKKNEVVPDDFQLQERIDGFKRRVFTNQLTNAFYYRFYQELLSDHFPVSINCKL